MEVSTCHWNMAEKHYNIISDVSRPQKYKHFYFKNQQPPARGLRVVCGVWWWLFITNVGCNRWYIVDWEELNKALNFTVFGRGKQGRKYSILKLNSTPDRPGPHLQIDQTIINIDIFFLLLAGDAPWCVCGESL